MNAGDAGLLQAQCILNTRPAHQLAGLSALLQASGAEVIEFPVIEIVATEPTAFHLNLAQNLEHYDIALFVSRNAVDGAFHFIGKHDLPDHLQLAVIGEGTYLALSEHEPDLERRLIRAHPYHSEALLAATALQQVAEKKILIFRGQQGRNLLGDVLRQRGAQVRYCEVYRRQLPDYDSDFYRSLSAGRKPTLVVFTSSEGMYNAVKLVDDEARQDLLNIPWLLISERMREPAVNLGHNAAIIIAADASNEGIQQAICEWTIEQSI